MGNKNTDEDVEVPTGLAHLEMVSRCAEVTQKIHFDKVNLEDPRLKLLGSSLSVLYQAATCSRGCRGGAHIFERFSAKAYNGISSTYILFNNGFYDEALNLIRGLGELANLLSMSFVEHDKFQEWLESDSRARKINFSPFKVRTLLEPHSDVGFLIVDKGWYGQLSEDFCHINPNMKPNNHNDARSVAGGIFQPNGVDKVIDEICNVSIPIAIMITRQMDFDDSFNELSTAFVELLG